jgi:hypothetical protein
MTTLFGGLQLKGNDNGDGSAMSVDTQYKIPSIVVSKAAIKGNGNGDVSVMSVDTQYNIPSVVASKAAPSLEPIGAELPDLQSLLKICDMFRNDIKKFGIHHDIYHAMTPSDNNELSDDVDRDSMLNEMFDTKEKGDDAVSCNVTVEVTPLPMSEATDLQLFAEDHRSALRVLDDQDLMIVCAWTTPPEKRLLKMFSEVLHIDCTSDTM